jgi:hypothetical protein
MDINHPKISKALEKFGENLFIQKAQKLLAKNSKHKVVLGLLGGPSTGRYGFSHTAGKKYPRYALRFEKGRGIVGISKHAGPYLYISL